MADDVKRQNWSCGLCSNESRSDLLCGVCIIIFLLALGLTLIILGESLDIVDSTILGGIFLVFGTVVSTCIIAMIVRPLYHTRKIGYSSTNQKDDGYFRQESNALSQHGGSVYINDQYSGSFSRIGSADRKTVSSVMVEVRPATSESKRSDMFLAKHGNPSLSSSNASFTTAPDQNRNSVTSENEYFKTSDDEMKSSSTITSKHKVSFGEGEDAVTKF